MAPDFIERADRALEAAYEEPTSLATYVERVRENPDLAVGASQYLLRAIEHAGTRTVIERGEELTRYRFFDDPFNDGEHAVLGNTRTLNAFVDDLRAIAANRGKAEKILWFAGPTATGKSELKRCLVNGLREFSKTDAGRRYTLEWNVTGAEEAPGLTYGDAPIEQEADWYESPVQSHPLSVFPAEVRQSLLASLNEGRDETAEIHVDADLDPFCREAYEVLASEYRRRGRDDVFSAATDASHLRVKNYVMDVGKGIGVLHSEDAGSPKERLVGTWMTPLLQTLEARGRKNPQAFSYDGVLSQGNGGLTIVEDAAQHADLLQRLLNVPDERQVKLDKGIQMDVDTQLLVISNLDLEAQLNQHEDKQGFDPLKALKRRLDRHEFGYLTSRSLETQLLRRELTGETDVWTAESQAEVDERVREPVTIRVQDDADVGERELAPHALAAAATYDVVSRLDSSDLPEDLTLVEKARLFDQGYVQDGDERRGVEEFDLDPGAADGANGIPVTYTRDVIVDLLYEERDRSHPDLPVERVVMPRDVLNAMVEGLADAPVFSEPERAEFEGRVVDVKEAVFERQADDVLAALFADERPAPETVEEYVEHVHAWATDDDLTNDRGEQVDPDPLRMKVFETETLGRFDEDDYDGTDPGESVRTFREDRILTALNRHAWENRTDDFRAADVPVSELPILQDVLGTADWEDVKRIHEDLDPRQWPDPPTGTATAALKERVLDYLVAERNYSRAAAELTSRHVMTEVSHRWD